jgi:uncharacterized OB-fold protein
MAERPLPVPTDLSLPFWQGLRRREFLLQRCRSCGAWRWTPQYLCTKCHSGDYDWAAASGRGRIYSFTIVHRPPTPAFTAPFFLVVVELDEGPLMLSNLIDCSEAQLRIDMPVRVEFEDTSDAITLYCFRPA